MKYEFISYDKVNEKATVKAFPNWFERLFGFKEETFNLIHRDMGWQSRFTGVRYIIWFYESGKRFGETGKFAELDDWLRVKYKMNIES
jgi:hypothetical protein